jgi:hypothetical protein
MLPEGEREPVEQLVRAQPNVFVFSRVQRRLEELTVGSTHKAVGSISAHEQIAVVHEFTHLNHIGVKLEVNAEVTTPLVQNVQEAESRDAGEFIAPDGDFLILVNDIHVIPDLTTVGDLDVGFLVAVLQVGKRLVGKNNTPAKRIIGTIPLQDGDVMGWIQFFHQNSEVQPRWSTADNVYVHTPLSRRLIITS